jgi:hypothetical protein
MGPAVNWARKEKQVRALRIQPASESPQADVSDILHHWAARQREQQLAARLDRLATVLERLAAVLERRAA